MKNKSWEHVAESVLTTRHAQHCHGLASPPPHCHHSSSSPARSWWQGSGRKMSWAAQPRVNNTHAGDHSARLPGNLVHGLPVRTHVGTSTKPPPSMNTEPFVSVHSKIQHGNLWGDKAHKTLNNHLFILIYKNSFLQYVQEELLKRKFVIRLKATFYYTSSFDSLLCFTSFRNCTLHTKILTIMN